VTSIDTIIQRAISPSSVREVGRLTSPPTFGVYRIPGSAASTRTYRIGNHPVRMRELVREFGSCRLEYLFTSREDAVAVARNLES
jgi:hypothetical protein